MNMTLSPQDLLDIKGLVALLDHKHIKVEQVRSIRWRSTGLQAELHNQDTILYRRI